MGIARGGLDLRVTEQLPDHGQALAEGQGTGCKGVAKVMDTHVVERGARPDTAPRVLEVGEVAAGLPGWRKVSFSDIEACADVLTFIQWRWQVRYGGGA